MDRDLIREESKKYDVRGIVDRKLTASGLPLPPKPSILEGEENIHTEWELLKNSYGGLDEIPFKELGEFLDKWTSVLTYTYWVEGVADMDQATAREARDTAKEQLYSLQEGGREIRAANVRTEEVYRELELSYTEKLAFYIGVKSLREGYEKRVEGISREITRRIGDSHKIRRTENV